VETEKKRKETEEGIDVADVVQLKEKKGEKKERNWNAVCAVVGNIKNKIIRKKALMLRKMRIEMAELFYSDVSPVLAD